MAKKSRFRSAGGSAKDEILNRTNESQKRQGGSGKWNDYLDDSFKGEKFVATDGDHLIDIIPYLAGENDPKLKAGDRSYMVDVYVHQKVGTNEDSVLCPASNYRGEKCPICEYQAKMRQSKQFTDEELKQLNAKRRVLYNVLCYDTPESESKGVMVWEASYHLTENEILSIARNRRGGGHIPFADPDEGKSIDFYREGTGSATRYKGYKFVDRDEPISDETLDAAYCLDELLDRKSYDEILEMFKPTAPPIPGEEQEDERGDERGGDREESRDHSEGTERKGRRNRSERKQEEDVPPPGDEDAPDEREEEQQEDEPEPEQKPARMARRRR